MTMLADAIKSLVPLPEAARLYGFTPNWKNYIKCPFHGDGQERTASMVLKPRYFKCYACGQFGTVIDFVMMLFDIEYTDALARLNADFQLGLTEDKPDPSALAQRRREREKQDRRRRLYEAEYRRRSDEYRRLWWAMVNKAPVAVGGDMDAAMNAVDPEYVEACMKLDALEWWFEENEYIKNERK